MTLRLHEWLFHRKAFKSCRTHCGCNCGSPKTGKALWCRHVEFGTMDGGKCRHCGRQVAAND